MLVWFRKIVWLSIITHFVVAGERPPAENTNKVMI
jgi:hypothetical protein